MITTDLLVETIDDLLRSSGMTAAEPQPDIGARSSRVFETDYAVVCVVGFDTTTELQQLWTESEDLLAAVVGAKLDRQDAKAWELYLVLATPDVENARLELDAIRTDTRRARKVVVTGVDESTGVLRAATLRRQLALLLPLPSLHVLNSGDPLDEIPGAALEGSAMHALVESFRDGNPLLGTLQAWLLDQPGGGIRA